MTRVSKQPLAKAVKHALSEQLLMLLVQADVKLAKSILHEFFTASEQVMFIKRLAMIMMLEKGYSKYRIAHSLAVSESTVKLIAVAFKAGRYDILIGATRKKDFDKEAFWKTVEVILRCGMPSMGSDRWQSWLRTH